MRHLSNLPEADKKNNFRKSVLTQQAVLKLVANLGVVSLEEVLRVYSPSGAAWHARVLSMTTSCLAWLYSFDERAFGQFTPSAETLEMLGDAPDLAASYIKKLQTQGTPRKLYGREATSLVDFETGQALPRLGKKGAPARAVLEAHWLRCRDLACYFVDSSARVQARRMLERLVRDGLLLDKHTPSSGVLYALTELGAADLGDAYSATAGRSWARTVHKTLATGYLLTALGEQSEGWSEGSLFAESAPSIHGKGAFFNHKSLHKELGWSANGSMHPSDAVIVHPRNEASGIKNWGVELVEAERGNKKPDEFAKSLYPLTAGTNKEIRLVRTERLSGGKTLKHVLTMEKITFVMPSEEFIAPLLTGCLQFITGLREDKKGVLAKTKKHTFVGSADSERDTRTARWHAKWEELLSMIDVAICSVSPVNEAFTGVVRKVSLADLARERGVSPQLYLDILNKSNEQ